METAELLWGLLFGSIGLGYVLYGRRQSRPVPFVCGLMLMGFPYLVDSNWALVLIGGALSAVPYFVRL